MCWYMWRSLTCPSTSRTLFSGLRVSTHGKQVAPYSVRFLLTSQEGGVGPILPRVPHGGRHWVCRDDQLPNHAVPGYVGTISYRTMLSLGMLRRSLTEPCCPWVCRDDQLPNHAVPGYVGTISYRTMRSMGMLRRLVTESCCPWVCRDDQLPNHAVPGYVETISYRTMLSLVMKRRSDTESCCPWVC